MSEVIGMIGNILFLAPFYAGDYVHRVTMDNYTKNDMVSRGVKEYTSKEELENSYWLNIESGYEFAE